MLLRTLLKVLLKMFYLGPIKNQKRGVFFFFSVRCRLDIFVVPSGRWTTPSGVGRWLFHGVCFLGNFLLARCFLFCGEGKTAGHGLWFVLPVCWTDECFCFFATKFGFWLLLLASLFRQLIGHFVSMYASMCTYPLKYGCCSWCQAVLTLY